VGYIVLPVWPSQGIGDLTSLCWLCLVQTLAYSVGMYGRAQAMRREGTAPAAMGVADDLPTRMAYEQLNALSGMANKVGKQSTITC
jgi:hypothetical protein